MFLRVVVAAALMIVTTFAALLLACGFGLDPQSSASSLAPTTSPVALGPASVEPEVTDVSDATAAEPPERWIDVSVATLWVKPGIARSIDAPACADPADPKAWVAGMTTEQKRWLVGRLETQALYGTRVYLLGTSGSWSRIAVPSQPTPRNRLGYPGWVPTRQLTSTEPRAGERLAIVRQRWTWLWRTSDLTERVLRLSYGTRLQAVSWTPTCVEVLALDGGHLFVRRSGVALHEPGTPWPRVTGKRLVEQARRLLGVPYLWAGTSGFCVDCSGFTHLVHRALNVTIPRDAGPQASRGLRIATRSGLLPGDLVFFRNSAGAIHHVGMYVGDGRMIHAAHTGAVVSTASLSAEPWRSEFAGGRRYWR
jgi:gamma-D-glutamyl-L-lysine dipeptidyl-peptidase